MTDATSKPETFIPSGSVSEPTYSAPTMDLRIYNGQVQQKSAIGRLLAKNGMVLPDRVEWRDVPIVNEQETT